MVRERLPGINGTAREQGEIRWGVRLLIAVFMAEAWPCGTAPIPRRRNGINWNARRFAATDRQECISYLSTISTKGVFMYYWSSERFCKAGDGLLFLIQRQNNRESGSVRNALVSKLRRRQLRAEKPKGARRTPAPFTKGGQNGGRTAPWCAPKRIMLADSSRLYPCPKYIAQPIPNSATMKHPNT